MLGLPDAVERLIIVLGLGSSGQKVNRLRPPQQFRFLPFAGKSPIVCPDNAGLVCSSITEKKGMLYCLVCGLISPHSIASFL